MTDTDDEMFAGMIAAAIAPNARAVTWPAKDPKSNLCPCGSGQIGYNLFDHKGTLLMYCCFTCEKPRRAQGKKDGETLTEDC